MSLHVYHKIKPLFNEDYKIEFLLVSESGYFPKPQGNHIVLRITNLKSSKKSRYILDPSFKRYDLEENLDDLYIYQTIDYELREKFPKHSYSLNINHNIPLG